MSVYDGFDGNVETERDLIRCPICLASMTEHHLYDNYHIVFNGSTLLGEEAHTVVDFKCQKCGAVFNVDIEVDPTFTYTTYTPKKNTAPGQIQDNRG